MCAYEEVVVDPGMPHVVHCRRDDCRQLLQVAELAGKVVLGQDRPQRLQAQAQCNTGVRLNDLIRGARVVASSGICVRRNCKLACRAQYPPARLSTNPTAHQPNSTHLRDVCRVHAVVVGVVGVIRIFHICQETSQPVLGQAQPRDQPPPAQQRQRHRLQRAPVCQLRHTKHIKALPILQLQARRSR